MKYLFALFCLLLLTVKTADAQLYKWVDEQGKVHYSDQPAGGKTKSESTLNIPSQPATPNGADSGKSWQDKEQEFQKRKASAAEAEAKKQKAEQEVKTQRENCEKAKQNLSQLESAVPVYTFNEKTGRTLLNQEQRTQEIAKARKSVAEWCK